MDDESFRVMKFSISLIAVFSEWRGEAYKSG